MDRGVTIQYYQSWERSQAELISNQNQNHRATNDFKSKSKIASLKVILSQNQKSPVLK
jgi:hypothetical protein